MPYMRPLMMTFLGANSLIMWMGVHVGPPGSYLTPFCMPRLVCVRCFVTVDLSSVRICSPAFCMPHLLSACVGSYVL